MVIVPQNVADARDRSPRDVRFLLFQLRGKSAAGFGKNLEISFNKLSRTPVRAKFLEVIPGSVRLDVGDRRSRSREAAPRCPPQRAKSRVIEMDVGIHGETGRRRSTTLTADAIAAELLEAIAADLKPSRGQACCCW